MHKSARKYGKQFFETYASQEVPQKIVDIGGMNVNGSLREYAPKQSEYISVDYSKGNGVDIILSDPYTLPIETASIDICVSSSCFEHSELFWVTYLEILRILKSTGVFYLNAPSNGQYHTYPVDCWRFFPDAGLALETWGIRNNYNNMLLESFIAQKEGGEEWEDFVAIFLRDKYHLSNYTKRMVNAVANPKFKKVK
jgi:SAM-dependent methyltransferase